MLFWHAEYYSSAVYVVLACDSILFFTNAELLMLNAEFWLVKHQLWYMFTIIGSVFPEHVHC